MKMAVMRESEREKMQIKMERSEKKKRDKKEGDT